MDGWLAMSELGWPVSKQSKANSIPTHPVDEEKEGVVHQEEEPAEAQERPTVEAEGRKVGEARHEGVDTEYEAHERPTPGGNIQFDDHPAVVDLD